MIASNDDDGPQPPRCPGCEWKLRVAGYLLQVAAGPDREWREGIDPIVQLLAEASAALQRLRDEEFRNGDGSIVAAARAAEALVDLSGEMLDLRDGLFPDGDGKDE
jgi:hypothetical protein